MLTSPPLSGETEPPAPEDLEGLRREEIVSRRVSGRVNAMEGKRVGRVNSARLQQKEAEKLGGDGEAIAIERIGLGIRKEMQFFFPRK